MAVKRQFQRRASTGLSFDSLIDVFMNVVGVLMITAVVLALTVSNRQAGAELPPLSTPVQEAPTPPPAPARAPAQLVLPQVREASTRPLYLLITGDGIRPFDGQDLDTTSRYFRVEDFGDSLELTPSPGRVMSAADFRNWLERHDPSERHLTAAITPDGVGYYREVRTIAADAGFRSGWLDHEGPTVTLGSGGRTGVLVQ